MLVDQTGRITSVSQEPAGAEPPPEGVSALPDGGAGFIYRWAEGCNAWMWLTFRPVATAYELVYEVAPVGGSCLGVENVHYVRVTTSAAVPPDSITVTRVHPGSGAGPAQPTPVQGAAGQHTTVSLVGGEHPLPVSLLDATGLVTGIRAVAPDVPGEGISTADDGSTVRYEWVGGACDERTELVFERVGERFRLSAATRVHGGACILIGLGRAVEIRLRLPIEESLLELQETN